MTSGQWWADAGSAGQMFRRAQRKKGQEMNDLLLRFQVAAQSVLAQESGQGMSEYAMTVALIAFGCIAGEAAIASSVNQTFVALATTITTGIFR
jgi:Flp pilus assembly pilin Flp